MTHQKKTPFLKEDLLRLRHLEHLRHHFVDQVFDIKRTIISLLELVFPEYKKLVSDPFGELGSIKRFKCPEQLVDFVGLDMSVDLLGDFNSQNTRMSKRELPYLRRAI